MTWFGTPSTHSHVYTTVSNSSHTHNVYNNSVYTTSGTSVNQNFTISTIPAAIYIQHPSTHLPALTIHYDGRIEYTGKPSQAAEAFYKALGSNIDINTAGKRALEKTYRRAIERCLRQARSMSHEDFITMLENELDTRTGKAVLMRLTEEESDA